MRQGIQKHRRARTAAGANAVYSDDGVWLNFVGHGSGFHDCPLCRELGSAVPTVVGIRPEIVVNAVPPEWIESLLELVGREAIVRLVGHDMEAEPLEEISMSAYLERLGYGE